MARNDDMTLTCKLGRFTLSKKVPLSHAKLLRDSVMGQFFNPQGGHRIVDEASAQDYAYEHLGRDLAKIPFSLEIDEKYAYTVIDEAGLDEREPYLV